MTGFWPRTVFSIVAACCAGGAGIGWGADDAKSAADDSAAVVATVNGDPIYEGEVDAMLSKLTKSQKVKPDQLNAIKAQLLSRLVDTRAVEQLLRRDGAYVNDADIDKEVDKAKTKARQQRVTLDQVFAAGKIGAETMRHEMAWGIGWQKYLEANLGKSLESYFQEHRKDLDGTVVRASHILLRPDRFNEPISQVIARAAKIREEIAAGKITFEEAVEKYSTGPSRRKQGDLGYFPRHGVMMQEFSKAAFDLDKGEISAPVATNFGVHLIRVTDIRPGNRQWTEVIEQIRPAAAADLFVKLARQEREKAKIEYTGKAPYFGDDGKLVLPEASSAGK